MILEKQWQTGRLGPVGTTRGLLFGQMYEDPEIEREAFAGRRRIFCIASAGSTALALADRHTLTACDINPAQLAYAERRLAGGPAETGDAERGMAFARRFMPLVGWRRSTLRRFLALGDVEEQLLFWKEHLDTARFRAGFRVLLSRMVLRAAYAPPFLAFLPPHFGDVVRARFERGFALYPNAANPFARALLLGEPRPEPAPAGAPVTLALGDAASCLEAGEPGRFDGFTLSNILDGADPAYRARLLAAVRRAAAPGAVVVMRSFGEPPAGMTGNLAARDRALLWGVVEARPAASLPDRPAA